MMSHSSGEGSAAWRVLDISAMDGVRLDGWLYEEHICVGAGAGGGAVMPGLESASMAVVMAGKK